MWRTSIFCNCQVTKGTDTRIKLWSYRYNIIIVIKLANEIYCDNVESWVDSTHFSSTAALPPYCIQIVNKMVISCFIHQNKPSRTIPQWKPCTSKNMYSSKLLSASKHQAPPCLYTIGLHSHRMTCFGYVKYCGLAVLSRILILLLN